LSAQPPRKGAKSDYLTKHPAHSEEGGEGNWLVSYADMMTLLVGFFIILNSFSVIDDEKFEDARKQLTLQFGGTYQIPYGAHALSMGDARNGCQMLDGSR
jgi:chemotaxis protein MotB